MGRKQIYLLPLNQKVLSIKLKYGKAVYEIITFIHQYFFVGINSFKIFAYDFKDIIQVASGKKDIHVL